MIYICIHSVLALKCFNLALNVLNLVRLVHPPQHVYSSTLPQKLITYLQTSSFLGEFQNNFRGKFQNDFLLEFRLKLH